MKIEYILLLAVGAYLVYKFTETAQPATVPLAQQPWVDLTPPASITSGRAAIEARRNAARLIQD